MIFDHEWCITNINNTIKNKIINYIENLNFDDNENGNSNEAIECFRIPNQWCNPSNKYLYFIHFEIYQSVTINGDSKNISY